MFLEHPQKTSVVVNLVGLVHLELIEALEMLHELIRVGDNQPTWMSKDV